MRLFGLDIRRTKSAVGPVSVPTAVTSLGGWWPVIRESVAGAWQRNIEVRTENVLSFAAVYACVNLIASDIGKLRIALVKRDPHGIWTETDNPAYSPVLRKPNHYQTRIQFVEHWLQSKLIHGNTYVLKERDQRRVVVALYVLDPTRCRPMVTPQGDVYYAIGQDNLANIGDTSLLVPASEIIHDRVSSIYHPLCGVPPISACGLAAVQGLHVQAHSARFFENGAMPGGILTAPGVINEETAKRMQAEWESGFSGSNYGRVAVLGDGLKFEPMTMMKAVDAQLIEQLKLSAEMVCTAFRVPAYMVGVGQLPSYNNVEALNQQYYAQCLQTHIESIELLLDEGLGVALDMGTEFDLDDLLRMDTPSRVKAAAESIGGGGMSPNEARQQYFGLGPVVGGDTPYLQQQNFSLAALAKRDAQADPFASRSPSSPAAPPPEPDDDAIDEGDIARSLALWARKEAELIHA